MTAKVHSNTLSLYVLTQNKIDALFCGETPPILLYQGVNCAPIIRSTILACLEQTLLLKQDLPMLKPRFLRQIFLKGLSGTARTTLPNFEKNSIVCVGHISGFSSFGGVQFNRFFDPICESLARINIPTSLLTHGHKNLGKTEGTPLMDKGYLLNTCIRNAMATRSLSDRFPKELVPHINTFLRQALDHLSPKIQRTIRQYIQRNLADTFACKTMFEEIFSPTPPRAIISTNYYTTIGWGLVIAAKTLNIPYIELQHGVQGPQHHAFNFPAHLNKTHPVPTRYLTWTEAECAHVQKQGHKADTLGPAWFHIFNTLINRKKDASPSKKISETLGFLKIRALGQLARHTKKRHLIFIGQGTQADATYKALKSELADDIALWRIERPGHTSDWHTIATQPIIPADSPLPLQLCFADGIVSEFSSSAIEARLLNRQVFFSSENGKHFFAFETLLSASFNDKIPYHSGAYISAHLQPTQQKGFERLVQAIDTLPNPAEKILSLLA